MVTELLVAQFWSEIIPETSDQTRTACLFHFEITLMILDQIALHSVQLLSSVTVVNYCIFDRSCLGGIF